MDDKEEGFVLATSTRCKLWKYTPPPSFYTQVDSGAPPESTPPYQIIPWGRFWEASQNLYLVNTCYW